MTKELFIETINALENQYIHDGECNKAFEIILPNDHVSFYDNHFITNQLLKIIKVSMNDDNVDSWIEYYIYELHFGKIYKRGCAKYKDGSIIDISDTSKLWDFLNKKSLE